MIGMVTRQLERRCKERASGMVLHEVESIVVTPPPIRIIAMEELLINEHRGL